MAIFIAPTASVMGRVFISKDVSVWYGAVIRADVEEIHLGEGCNIQDNAVIHVDPGFPTQIGHDCILGDYNSIMANVDLGGKVQIFDHVFLGDFAGVLGVLHRHDHP